MVPRDPFGAMRFPVLEPPPGAEVQGSGGGGSSGGIETHVSIVSDLPVEVIFEHYAHQLDAAGWIPKAVWALTGANTYRAWARMDRPARGR